MNNGQGFSNSYYGLYAIPHFFIDFLIQTVAQIMVKFRYSLLLFSFILLSTMAAHADGVSDTVKYLRSLSTDSLISLRATNNVYHDQCASHDTYSSYDIFYQIASDVIIDELTERSEMTNYNQSVYSFRKGLLIGTFSKMGLDSFCNCIYLTIMKGKSDCTKG